MTRMVNVSKKRDVRRKSVAKGEIILKQTTLTRIKAGRLAKGNVLAAAEVAALQAIKKVWEVLPHTHPIPITSAGVNLKVGPGSVSATASP